MLSTPLQVAVFAADGDQAAEPYRAGLVVAFQGGDTGYFAGASDTGVPVREFAGAPEETPEDLLGGALHTLGIVLVSRALLEDAAALAWLGRLAEAVDRIDDAAPDRHKLMVLDLDASLDGFLPVTGSERWPQAIAARDLGERAVRPAVAGLVALNLALQALGSGVPGGGRVRLFISHAKIDGQPLANAIAQTVKGLPGFQGFYDAEDIPVGANWRRVLRESVRDSIVIVLRSGIYEDRAWCFQEMLWAEEFGSPYVVVDLRARQIEPPSRLSLDRAPTVRVADGNLLRIVFVALREGLKARLHLRGAEAFVAAHGLAPEAVRVLVRRPTLHALHAACAEAPADRPMTILYPDPQMPEAERLAAEAMARAHSPQIRVGTPETLLAEGLR